MTKNPTDPAPAQAVVTFWGAAQMVTGSMHLLERGSTKVLFDCGLHQSNRSEARERNAQFPFAPKMIDAVLVSHAHIDHCGNLPSLIRQGFSGPIYCTHATRDLLEVMLIDSAKIQVEEAELANAQRHYGQKPVQPLYSRIDVDQVLHQCKPIRYDVYCHIDKRMRFKFVEAGHVLGSAMIHLISDGPEGERSLTFTGDLGRRNLPLLRRSSPIPAADVLMCESTYGNRVHEPIETTVSKLYQTINNTIRKEGKILIPAFSLGRTQLIIHYIQKGILDGHIPKIPVYVDSPLAADITEVYESHPELLTEESQRMLEEGTGILGGDLVTYIRDFEDSVRTSLRPGPMIVIASSGMCDAGRILHHLKQNVDDPRCTIILVSYQAQGTTGRRLLEKTPTVRFQGREWNKWIDVVHLDGFSGHADRDDFLDYLSPLAKQIGQVRLIHGEREQAESLAETLRGIGFKEVDVPMPGDRVILGGHHAVH